MQHKLKKSKVFPEILLGALQLLSALAIGCLSVLATVFQAFANWGTASTRPAAMWLLSGVFLTVLLFICGVRNLTLASRFQKVVTVFKKGSTVISLADLSESIHCPVDKLNRDLQTMIGRDYFSAPVQLDLYRQELVLGNAVILPPTPAPGDAFTYKETARRGPGFFVPTLVVAACYTMLFELNNWLGNTVFALLVLLVAFGSYKRAVPQRRLVQVKRPREKAIPVKTGDKDADSVLNEARGVYDELHHLTQTMTGTPMDASLEKIRLTGADILKHLEKQPEKLRQVRQFLNYYLPTTLKLLRTYEEFRTQPVKGDNIRQSMQKIEKMMQDIAAVFHKELDNLYLDRAVDVSADIDVMKAMLNQEGIHQGEILTVDFGTDK